MTELIPTVSNMCAYSDGIVPINTDLLFTKTPGWEKMDSRLHGNDSMAQELIPIGIMAIFSKKRLHLSGGSDTIHNIRGFLWKAYKNVIQPHCRLVGGK